MISRQQVARAVSAILGTTVVVMPTLALSQELEEVVVTATRRSTSVLDVPYNISAYSSDQLSNSHVTDISDFAKMVPGLAYVDPGPRVSGNNNEFILRGVNASSTQGLDVTHFAIPTVSTYLGETPVFYNVQALDLQRIEVLRGPQGTLYGAGSLSGTIRFIPNAPQMNTFSAEVIADGSYTDRSGHGNYNLGAIFNLPIASMAAFRVSAGYDHRAGFIDETNLAALDKNGVPEISGPVLAPGTRLVTQQRSSADDSSVSFARAALGVNLGSNAYVELHYNYQHSVVGDKQADNPTFPGNTEYQLADRVLTPFDSVVNVFGIDGHVDFGFATISSATSYSSINTRSIEDDSGFYSTLPPAFYFGYSRFVVPAVVTTNQYSFAQELRLASRSDQTVEWLVGAWFNRDIKHYSGVDQPDLGLADFTGATLGEPAGPFDVPSFVDDVDVDFRDTAIFGDLTWHITDRWQLSAGGRQFWQRNDGSLFTALPYCAATGGGCPAVSAVNNAVLQDHVAKLNASYAFDPKNRVYATFSQGFRPGGANAVPTTGPYAVAPAIAFYRPDRTDNYEVGFKGVERGVNYSIAAYYIRWHDFQFDGFTSAGYNAVLNGSEATSRGLEAELSGHIGPALTYDLGYGYTEAKVDRTFTTPGGSGGNEGDPLPGVPRNTVSAAIDYLQHLAGNYTLDYHLNGSYKAPTVSLFNDTSTAYFHMPGFTLLDAALTLGSGRWSTSLYCQNLTDKRAVFGGTPAANVGSSAFYLINRPRTIGIRINVKLAGSQ